MPRVVPLKPICIEYQPNSALAGGAHFCVLRNLKELSEFWEHNHHRFSYIARGRRWGSRQLFLNPGEWIFAPTIPSLVRAVTRWDEMGIAVEWHRRNHQDPEENADYLRQSERLRRLTADTFQDRKRAAGIDSGEIRDGHWQLRLPPSLKSFGWFSEHSSRIHYPGLTAEQAAEIFQLRTYEDWRQSNMREVDFMRSDDLDDLISCCQGAAQKVDF